MVTSDWSSDVCSSDLIAGETLHALSKRHDISRQLIRIWVGKFEAGAAGCNELIGLLKWTSLASVISVMEPMEQTNLIAAGLSMSFRCCWSRHFGIC
jgi:hypothetical protein